MMAVYKRGGVYWFNFIYAGRRVQKSAKTKSKTVAKEAEADYRKRLERVHAGMPAEKRQDRIRTVSEMVKGYLENFDINHRERTVAINRSCLTHVTRCWEAFFFLIWTSSGFATTSEPGWMRAFAGEPST